MSNTTSDEIIYSHMEREFRQKAIEKKAMADFREYLIGLFENEKQNKSVAFGKSILNFFKKLEKECETLKKEKEELFEKSKMAADAFSELLPDESDKNIPEDILKKSDLLCSKLAELDDLENEYWRQLALNEEFKNYAKKLTNLEKLLSPEEKVFFERFFLCFANARIEQNATLRLSKKKLEEFEKETNELYCEVYDELDMWCKTKGAKQKE